MSYEAEILADSPTIYWRLDEASGTSAADSSGNGHTGTRSGGCTFGVPGIGDGTLAASFDGVDGLVKSTDTFGPAVYSEFCFGVIAQPATIGGFKFMFGFYGATDDFAYMAIFADGSFDFGWNLIDQVIAPPGTLTAGVAHDFFVDMDATTATLYLDGVAIDTAPANDLTLVEVGGIPFRAGFDEDGDPFDGVLAAAVFFDHSVGATRIAAYHAARGSGGTGTFRFTPPTEATVSNVAFDALPMANALRRYYPIGPRGKAVWHLEDDTISFDQPYPTVFPDAAQHSDLFPVPAASNWWGSNLTAVTAKVVYYGGHTYIVDTDEEVLLAAFLTAQGYDPNDWLVPL